jgi:hypothetical protein
MDRLLRNYQLRGNVIPQGGSSSKGITCTDLTTGAYFVIGDYLVRVNNGAGESIH